MFKTSDITPDQFYECNENQDFSTKDLNVLGPAREKATKVRVKGLQHVVATSVSHSIKNTDTCMMEIDVE